MDKSHARKKLNALGIDVLEWMLAIDFDTFEFRRSRKNVFEKYIQVLDKSDFSIKRGD